MGDGLWVCDQMGETCRVYQFFGIFRGGKLRELFSYGKELGEWKEEHLQYNFTIVGGSDGEKNHPLRRVLSTFDFL